MPKGRAASVEVQRQVTGMTAEGFTPAQIYRELEGQKWPGMDRGLDLRTIQRMVRKAQTTDETDPWSFLDADEDGADLILEVALWASDALNGRVWPSRALAEWIRRVRALAPDIPLNWALFVARAYQLLQEKSKKESRILDVTLAGSPWSSPEQAADWASALRRWGWVSSHSEHYDETTVELLEWLAGIDLRRPDDEPPPDTQVDTLADGQP